MDRLRPISPGRPHVPEVFLVGISKFNKKKLFHKSYESVVRGHAIFIISRR